MNFGPYDMLMDFGIMSILLFVAQVIRAKVKFVQNMYLPASMIAGFLGLFLGSQFLNILPFSRNIASYPYMMIVVLFAGLFLGNNEKSSFKEVVNKVGDTFTLNLAAEVGQFGFAIVIGGLILTKLFPQVNHSFALLMPAGFVGGHGYAAAIGGTLKDILGWDEAITIGQTFATLGLLCGVFGGIILINIATRVKATRLIKTMGELPKSMQTGLIPKKEQNSMGLNTINSMSLDSLTWHVGLVLIATAGGYYAFYGFKRLVPNASLPMMSLSMLAGVLLQFILNRMKLAEYIDKKIMTRIGGASTDFLVGFGIASIKISVVIKYAIPILIMLLIGVVYALLFLSFIGRRLFHNFWFERSIFIYGWITGVVAMGVTLLRIVDPEFKTEALEDYGMAYVFISFIELFIVSVVPLFVAKGQGLIAGVILLIVFSALLIITATKYGVQSSSITELREGESEVIAELNNSESF